MSTHPNDPTNGFNPSEHGINAEDLEQILTNAEFRLLDSEPKVRDFNRNIADLLGECPNTATGNWLTLNEDGTVTFHIHLVDVLRLSTAFQKIGESISLKEVRRSLPSRQSFMYELVEMFREKKPANNKHRASAEQSVHLGGRKKYKFRKKGA
jgi:hypothetical protein